MALWSKPKSSTSLLLVDINSASVGAGLVVIEEGSLPEIIYSIRRSVSLEDGSRPMDTRQAVLVFLRKVLEEVAKEGGPLLDKKSLSRTPENVLVALSSPWSHSRIANREITQSESFAFDQEFLTLLKREESKNFSNQEKVFEQELVSLRLNGYETVLPLSKRSAGRAKSISADLILSAAEGEFIENIEQEIEKIFNLKHRVNCCSFNRALFHSIRAHFGGLNSATLINMTPDSTDLVLTKERRIVGTTTLKFGPNSIVKAIATKLHLPPVVARSYLSTFARGAFDPKMTAKLDSIILGVESDWQKIWLSVPETYRSSEEFFLIAETDCSAVCRTMMTSVSPRSKIVSLAEDESILRKMVKVTLPEIDSSLVLLSTFSNDLI